MPPSLSKIRAILFDLWNTVSFSEFQPNPMLLIAEALRVAGRPDWRKTLERGMMRRPFLGIREALENLETETGNRIESPAARDRLIRQWNEACAATRIYHDVMPTLRALRPRFRLGILSNTQSFDLDFLKTRGLEPMLDAVCLSCELGRLKPDPMIFAAAAERIGSPPGEVLMVGDSAEDDVLGALRAGLAAVHLCRDGAAGPVPGAARTIRTLTEIPSLLPGRSVGAA